MAVKHKIGLDYFSFDVDFFSDEKIEFVAARFGAKGELITIKLLCKVYRNGYYCEWTEDDATMFAKRVGDGVTPALVNDVVAELAKRGFFNKDILSKFNILTSAGIQKRYLEATERRKTVELSKHLLLVNVVKNENVNITGQNVNISPQDVSIHTTKERKGKESKVNERKEEPPDIHPPPNGLLDIDLLKEKIFLDKEFVARFSNWGISEEFVWEWLMAFNRWLSHTGVKKKIEKDYRTHFGNWLKTQDLTGNPKNYSPITKPIQGYGEGKNTGKGAIKKISASINYSTPL